MNFHKNIWTFAMNIPTAKNLTRLRRLGKDTNVVATNLTNQSVLGRKRKFCSIYTVSSFNKNLTIAG